MGERLTGTAAGQAVKTTLGESLARVGLKRSARGLYGAQRDDQTWILASTAGGRKESLPNVASSVRLLLGLGTELSVSDMRTSAMGSLGGILGSGPACAQMCRVHNAIVSGWKALGPDASRAATLLSWTVRELDQNAPEVLWYRDAEDLATWARFLDEVLPRAVSRLRAATIKPGLLMTFDFAAT